MEQITCDEIEARNYRCRSFLYRLQPQVFQPRVSHPSLLVGTWLHMVMESLSLLAVILPERCWQNTHVFGHAVESWGSGNRGYSKLSAAG
jgi:hypothetical protein